MYHPGTEKFVGTFTVPSLLSVRTDRGTETPMIGISRCIGRERRIGFATRVGGGDFECASSRGERSAVGIDVTLAEMLDAGLVVVAVVVVVGVEAAGGTSKVVVVVGDGITMPDDGSETTPIEEVRVGPWGWLRGTNTIPRIPARTSARDTAHQRILVGRLSLCDFTSPI